MKRRIPVLPIIAVLTALVAGVSIARMQTTRKPTEPPSPPARSAFQRTVAAVGLIEANSENIRIGSPLAGIVEEVHVRAGDAIDAGAPLFRLETRHLRAALGDADAALQVAKSEVGIASAELADVRQQLALAQSISDKRAISEDDLQRRRHAVATAEARLARAHAAVEAAGAERQRVRVEIERSIVRSPIAATVLKVNIRSGEFASAGALAEPLLVLGDVEPLFVRVDVDEHEAGRVRAEASAVASLRGNASITSPLRFVRFEPLVIPKRALTGDSAERVDTRVLQIIYAFERKDARFFVGQQVDVFIDDPKGRA